MGRPFLFQEMGESIWRCSLGKRSLYTSPAGCVTKESFVTAHLVPDMDFHVLRMECALPLKNYLPVFTPLLCCAPLEQRLIGRSVSDFLTLFRLEQYEGLIGYGKAFAGKMSAVFAKIPLEDSEDFTLEARVKDIGHAFDSHLLQTILSEIKEKLQAEKSTQEKLELEKQIIQLRLELGAIVELQREKLRALVDVFESVQLKSWMPPFYCLAKCAEALYRETAWVKITLLTNYLEGETDSWMTYPKERNFLAPFILKCAFEAVRGSFNDMQLLDAIIHFKGPVVEPLQNAFVRIAALFNAPLSAPFSRDRHDQYDQHALQLVPPSMLMPDPEHPGMLALKEENQHIFNF
jgi:hypothetical protein